MKIQVFKQKIKEYQIELLKTLIGSKIADITTSNVVLNNLTNDVLTKEITLCFSDTSLGFLTIRAAILENENLLFMSLNDFAGIQLDPIECKYPGVVPMHLLPNYGNRIRLENEFIVDKIDIYCRKFTQKGRKTNLCVDVDTLIIFYSLDDDLISISASERGLICICFTKNEVENIINSIIEFPFVDNEIVMQLIHVIQRQET